MMMISTAMMHSYERAPKAWVPRDKPVGAVPAHGNCVSSVPNRATPNSEAASTQMALSSSSSASCSGLRVSSCSM